ncbi:MAG: autotransporter-associated beta strand repeat-containing protein [Pirellulales bacterium]
MNAGVDYSVYAARLDANVTLGTATDNTAQLIVGSGGLLINGARTVTAGLQAGNGTAELLIYNNNTATLGDNLAANRAFAGQIAASALIKFGAGQLNLNSEQQTFSGPIRVQQGELMLRYANGTETNPISNVGGIGSTIFMEGANSTLSLRGGQDNLTGSVTFNNSVVLGDYNPIVQFNVDRQGGTITNVRNVIANNFTFGANNLETGQIARFVGANTMDFQLGSDATDLLTLVGKSVIQVEAAGQDVFVAAKTTGSGRLIKSQAGVLQLDNVTNLNDWSGGTTVMNGTFRIMSKAANVAANTNSNLTAGGVGGGPITLMGGTMDFRVDTAAVAADADIEFIRYSSTGVGPDLTIGGATTITADRAVTAFDSNKMITFNNLTVGSQIFTTTSGNSYGFAFAGTTTLQGNAFFNFGVETVLGGSAGATGTGSISDGGAGVLIHKVGAGTLWVHSVNNSLSGPIYINQGALDFGNRSVANTSATIGTGDIFVNAGAEIRVRGVGNINTALGQQVRLTGTAYSPAVLRALATNLTQANYQAMVEATTSTSNDNVIISFENAVGQNLDQSTIGNGRVFFGNAANATYSGATVGSSLTPGLANSANSVVGGNSTNRVYRLGGRTSNTTLTIDLTASGANLTDVAGPTDLLIGSLANLGPAANWGLGQVLLADQNTYTGSTIVSRGSLLRFSSATSVGDTAGPLGVPGANLVDVYGSLQAQGANGTFRNNIGTANAYTNIRLHPGSSLILLDNTASTNRWDNSTGVNLDGARFVLDAANNTDLCGETIGALVFDRGARIATVNEGTSEILLTAASVTRAASGAGAGTGRGTLVFVPAVSASLGLPSATNNAEQVLFTSDPTVAYPTTSAISGLLPGFFVDGTGNRFVTYNTTTGVVPVTDGQMASAFTAGMTAGTAVVNITAAVTLPDFAPSIYALRTSANINSPTGANNDATITFAGSGNDIGSLLLLNTVDNTTVTVSPNLRFGTAGTSEGLIYFAGGGTGRNMALAGFITAGSMTKFGAGTIQIVNDQSDAARGVGIGYSGGWVINEGGLNLLTFGSAGNAVASNTIVLNANQASTPTLFLRAQPADSLLNYAYTSGRIITVDNGVIDWDPGADDRVHQIADLEIQQSGGIGSSPTNGTNDAQLRVAVVRNRSILAAGQLILTSNAILNVDATNTGNTFAGATNTAAALTNGVSNGLSVASLTGSGRLTKWGDGYLYVRGASTNTGAVVIDEGAVHVTHNASLGSGDLVINRYGVLDVGVAGYAPTNASVTYNEGSVERWSVDNARTGTVNLGKATLQVGADQTGTVTVTLNGGSIEGWLRTDDVTSTSTDAGVFRNLGANVSINLAGNSYLGNPYYLGVNGLDSGRGTNDFRPTAENAGTGAILNIRGVISGNASMTKVGYDTVVLSNNNTYSGGTTITGGTLRVGINNALLPTGTLSTQASGVLDLNGYNQTVGILTNPVDAASNTSGINNGYITNSSAGVRTLTAGNGAAGTFTYRGVIQHNVALQKIGAGRLVLTNSNTYVGGTTVTDGVLQGLAATSGSPFGSGGFTLAGGTLALVGIDATTNTATAGTLTVTETSILRLDGSANTAGITQFTVGSLVQQNGAGLIVVPVTGRLGDPGTKERFTVTNTTGLLSGGIVPWVFAADTPTPNSTLSFVTLSGNNLVSTSSATSIDVPNAAPNLAYVAATGNDNNLDSDPNWGSVQVNAGVTITAAPLGYVLTLGDGNSGTLLLNGGNSLASGFFLRFSGQGNIVTAGASSSIVGANIVNSAAGVTINGSQPVIFTGTNSYTGPTLIQSAQLTINSAASIPSNNAITLSNDAGAALVFNSNATVGSIAGGGAAGGNVSIGANSLTVNQAANVTYAGTINGAGNIFKQGAGVWTLSGTSNFTGQMQIDAGTISIASEANLGADAGALNFNQLIFNGGTLQTTATMAINDTSRGITVSAFGGAVNVANNTTLSIANPVSGGGGDFTKTGGGTLTFTNNTNHFYASNLVVAGGTVNGNGHIPAQVTVQAGGTLSAGSNANGVNNNGVGTIAFGDFGVSDWQNNASFVFDFGNNGSGTAGTDWDLITIGAGGLNLSGSNYLLTVFSWDLVAGTYGTNNFNPNALPTIDVPEPGADAAYRWLWVDNAGPLSGVVDGRLDQFVVAVGSPAAYPTISGGNFWVSAYSGKLYLNYSAVPEPGSLFLVGLASLGFAAYRRRRKAASKAEADSTKNESV